MKKTFTSLIKRSVLATALSAMAAIAPSHTAHADLLMDENFDYTTGDLYNQGNWVKYASNPLDPIQVVAGSLTYQGYIDNSVGNKVAMKSTASGQDLFKFFNDNQKVGTGKLYVSFLLNVSNPNSAKAYFMGLIPQTKAGLKDGGSGTEFAKMYISNGSDDSHFKLSVSRSGAITTSTYTTNEYEIGRTYLVVLGYEFVSGDKNDKCYLWVNPVTDSETEPTPDVTDDKSGTGSDPSTSYGGFTAIELRQGATSSNPAPEMTIDAIRIATTWAELFPEQGETPTTPAVLLGSPSYRLDECFPNMALTTTNFVGGENLTGDITITCSEGLSCNKTSISAAEAMAPDPVELTFSYTTPSTPGEFSYVATFTSPGAEEVTFSITGTVLELSTYATAQEVTALLNTVTEPDYETLIYTGKAVVSFVEKVDDAEFNIYAQDSTGGIKVNTLYTSQELCPIAVGNEITNLYFMFEPYFGQPVMLACPIDLEGNFATVSGTGLTVEPLSVEVANMTGDALKQNIFRLCNVPRASFKNATGNFEAGKSYTLTTADNREFSVRVFAGSDLIGTPIPQGNVSVTGISTSTAVFSLSMRMKADLTEVAEQAPVISVERNQIMLRGEAFPGMSLTAEIVVAGENLTGDITVTCPEGVSASPATIAPSAATIDDPAQITISFTTPKTAGDFSIPVTLSSPGAEDVICTIMGSVLDIPEIPNAAQIQNILDQEYETFHYSGKAVVTYIEEAEEFGSPLFNIYAQDMFGGLKLNTSYTYLDVCPIAVGDEITDIYFMPESVLGTFTLYALPVDANSTFCSVTATGKTKTPAETTIAAMDKSALPSAIYKLYTLSGVRIKDADGNFEANRKYTITDGSNEASMMIFASSDLVGTPMPTGNFTLTGLSTSAGTFIIMPRSKADITVGAPAVTITPEKTFDFTVNAAPVGADTEIAQYTVVAENLPVAVPVLITGQDAPMFRTEPNEIPAGSATTVVKVIYKPTSIGMHKGGIMFDFDAVNPEFNYSAQFGNCKAYDPQNLPAITIEPAVIELETTPGGSVTGTAVLNATGAFDYITATRSGSGDNGGITINNTYLLPNSENVTLTVTFSPKAEGEYTDTWTYTTMMCNTPATITVKAKCVGEVPEEPVEGDEEVKVDWNNAHSWYTQDFASVQQNKPLSIEGWSNVAVEGKRAWWGYTGANGDDFTAAKVTAYDSQVKPGHGSECKMLLVSPALDFKNAPVKKLKFRIMGMYLNENSGDELTIQLGENVNGETEFYEMEGFTIPATADEAGQWIEYDVDMSVIADMPDVFVIGFAFSGTRGADNSTTYYIDDFEWGAKEVGIESLVMGSSTLTPDADGYYTLYNLQGVCVLRTLDINDVKTLPAGLYISRGAKVIVK